MNIHILLVSLFYNAYVSLNYCLLVISSLLFIMFLLILCNFVTYCFELIACRNSSLSMTNSTFSLTCADDGSMAVCVCICVCVCVCVCVCALYLHVCILSHNEGTWLWPQFELGYEVLVKLLVCSCN
jgi:hypothetical protein